MTIQTLNEGFNKRYYVKEEIKRFKKHSVIHEGLEDGGFTSWSEFISEVESDYPSGPASDLFYGMQEEYAQDSGYKGYGVDLEYIDNGKKLGFYRYILSDKKSRPSYIRLGTIDADKFDSDTINLAKNSSSEQEFAQKYINYVSNLIKRKEDWYLRQYGSDYFDKTR